MSETTTTVRAGETGRQMAVRCAVWGCESTAGGSGFCGDCEPQIVAMLLDRTEAPMEIEALSLDWYRFHTGSVISESEASMLRLAVLAEFRSRQAKVGADWRSRRDVMRDAAPLGVKDEPANRARRAEMMAKIPGRIPVEPRFRAEDHQLLPWWGWLAVFAVAAVFAIVGCLYGHGRAF